LILRAFSFDRQELDKCGQSQNGYPRKLDAREEIDELTVNLYYFYRMKETMIK